MESLEVKMNMSVAEKPTSLTVGKFLQSMKIVVLEVVHAGHSLNLGTVVIN